MKISIEHTEYEDGHDIAVTTASDDLNITEIAELLRGLLVGFGYAPENVEQILPRE